MKASTHTIKRLAATVFAAAAAIVVVPAAYAGFDGPPDAIDRYNANQPSGAGTLALGGSPDAIDRYQKANEPVPTTPAIQGSPDAIDRYNANQASDAGTLPLGGSPDAIDRFQRANASQPIQSPPDWIERYAARTPTAVTVAGGSGFDWADFGIGAAAMLGMVLILAGFGVGVQVARHKTGRIRTS